MNSIIGSCIVVLVVFIFTGLALANEGATNVLFDQGHNQRFLIEEKGELQLSKLADVIRGKGLAVVSTKKPLSDETLKGISALVISGPFDALKPEEVESVMRFIEAGGRFAAMLHIGSPFDELFARLDIDHSNAVLHERKNTIDTDINFRVTGLATSPLFAGLDQFSVYGCWALDPGKTGTPIVYTSSEAWVDLDGDKKLSKGDASGVFNVAVTGMSGAGSFVVFADDAIFQNRYLDEYNQRLAENLADWMMTP